MSMSPQENRESNLEKTANAPQGISQAGDNLDHDKQAARGMKALTSEEFNVLDSVGGVRGFVEAVLPGLIYMVVFISTQDLKIALVGSLGIAALMVIVRLIQRTPVTMAFSGIFGVAIGLYVAWKSGDAEDFYVWGLLVNAGYFLAMIISIAVRWPAVGLLVELMKSGFGIQKAPDATAQQDQEVATYDATGVAKDDHSSAENAQDEPIFEFPKEWRQNAPLFKAYTLVTWLWAGLFIARLAVQLPLYLMGSEFIAALGTARLVMGVPFFALILWLSWRIIRQAGLSEGPQA